MVMLLGPRDPSSTTTTVTVTAPGVGSAVFLISNPAPITILDLVAGTGTITATVTLDSTTIPRSAADLTPFNAGGTLTLDYSGVGIQLGMVTFIAPDAAAGALFQATAVPEPASLALAVWGLIGMAGMWYTRRR